MLSTFIDNILKIFLINKQNKQEIKNFNTRVDSLIEESSRLSEVCKLFDEELQGIARPKVIYISKTFEHQRRRALGAQANIMQYDGIPLKVRDQPEKIQF